MNSGKNYEERWRSNYDLPFHELELFVREEGIPFLRDVAMEVCFTAGIPWRNHLLGPHASVDDFLKTLREIETKRAFLAHYIAEDAIMKLVAQAERQEGREKIRFFASR